MKPLAAISIALLLATACHAQPPMSLQGMIDAAEKATVRLPAKRFGQAAQWVTPEVEIAGYHNLTQPLRLPRACRVKLTGVLDGRGLPEGCFAIEGGGWRGAIYGGGAIVGGHGGISLDTGSFRKNLDVGSFRIADIQFAGQSGPAVLIECRSSVVVVERCVMDNCGQVVVNTMCDDLTLRSLSVTAPSGERAPIETSYGKLSIEGGIFTPPRSASTDIGRAWIETVGGASPTMVMVQGARFGGEHRGWAVLRNKARGRTRYPSSPGVVISLTNCHAVNVPATGAPHESLVILDEPPNQLIIRDCYGMVLVGPLVTLGENFDPSGFSPTGINNRLTIDIGPHARVQAGGELPESLKPFRIK